MRTREARVRLERGARVREEKARQERGEREKEKASKCNAKVIS